MVKIIKFWANNKLNYVLSSFSAVAILLPFAADVIPVQIAMYSSHIDN